MCAILYKQQFRLMMDLVKGELGIVHCACTEVSEHVKVYCVHTLCCEHRVLARVCSRVNCSQQLLAEGGLGAGSSCCLAVRPPQHRLHLNFTHRTSVFNWRRFKPHLSKSGFHQTGAIGHTSVKIQDTLHPAWLDRQTFFSEQLLL